MAAAEKTLDILSTTDALAEVAARGKQLQKGLSDIFEAHNLPFVFNGHPSMFGVVFAAPEANDGDLAALLTHPRHGVEREYEVRVRGAPDAGTLARLSRGVRINGRRTAPAEVALVRVLAGRQQSVLAVVVREGRKRQVRLMCEAVGHPVVWLRRVRIGPLADATLRRGEVRELAAREVAALRRATRPQAQAARRRNR